MVERKSRPEEILFAPLDVVGPGQKRNTLRCARAARPQRAKKPPRKWWRGSGSRWNEGEPSYVAEEVRKTRETGWSGTTKGWNK